MDNKPVSLLSTNSSPLEVDSTSRRLKDGSVVQVRRPSAVTNYQAFYRGVDITDQLRSKYPVGRPSKKWWKYLLNFLIKICVINAYLLFKECKGRQGAKAKHVNFRVALATQLIGSFRSGQGQSTSVCSLPGLVSDSNEHKLLRLARKRSHCKNYRKSHDKKRKDTTYGCRLCNVHLCGKVCFNAFHGFHEE